MRTRMLRGLAIGVVGMALGVAGCGTAPAGSPSPAPPSPSASAAASQIVATPTVASPSPQAAVLLWPAPPDPMELTVQAGLKPQPKEFLTNHVHAHLDVFVDGKPVTVPSGIGIKIDNPAVRRFTEPDGSVSYGGIDLCNEACISPLHTHDVSGMIHTESADPKPNNLGELFTEWDVPLDASCVANYCSPATPIAIYVDGELTTGDPRAIELTNQREIAIVIGTPPPEIPKTADFSQASAATCSAIGGPIDGWPKIRPVRRQGILSLAALLVVACSGGSRTSAPPVTASPASTAATSAASPSVAAVPSASSEKTVYVGGDRPAAVIVPSGYEAGRPAPLLILLHGYGSSGRDHDLYFHLGELAAERGYLYVHPDGTYDDDGNRFWNATDACCDFDRKGIDDATYLAGVITEIQAVVRRRSEADRCHRSLEWWVHVLCAVLRPCRHDRRDGQPGRRDFRETDGLRPDEPRRRARGPWHGRRHDPVSRAGQSTLG